MAKPEWGTKRTCQSCGARFYDLRQELRHLPEMRHDVRSGGGAEDATRATTAVAEKAAPSPPKAKPRPKPAEVEAEDAAEGEEAEVAEGEEEEEGVIEDTSELGEDEDEWPRSSRTSTRTRSADADAAFTAACIAAARLLSVAYGSAAGTQAARPEFGAIAQLGERYNGIVEVSGSIPLGSTNTKGLAGNG